MALNNIEQLNELVPDIIEYVLISDFGLLVDISIGIAGFAVGLKICVITARIKKYESIIKEKRKNMMKQYC